jgi:hypothetical protein
VFPVGFAYLDLERSDTPHLWIVCAENPEDADERVIFSITSDGPHVSDRSCELKPGDHEFIKHDSVVLFRKGAIVTVGTLQGWMNRGNILLKEAASAPLVQRICNAALESQFTPRDVKAILRSL